MQKYCLFYIVKKLESESNMYIGRIDPKLNNLKNIYIYVIDHNIMINVGAPDGAHKHI